MTLTGIALATLSQDDLFGRIRSKKWLLRPSVDSKMALIWNPLELIISSFINWLCVAITSRFSVWCASVSHWCFGSCLLNTFDGYNIPFSSKTFLFLKSQCWREVVPVFGVPACKISSRPSRQWIKCSKRLSIIFGVCPVIPHLECLAGLALPRRCSSFFNNRWPGRSVLPCVTCRYGRDWGLLDPSRFSWCRLRIRYRKPITS